MCGQSVSYRYDGWPMIDLLVPDLAPLVSLQETIAQTKNQPDQALLVPYVPKGHEFEGKPWGKLFRPQRDIDRLALQLPTSHAAHDHINITTLLCAKRSTATLCWAAVR